MKQIKKKLAAIMALALSAAIFVGVPVEAKAAGNVPDAYVGTYVTDAGEAVKVTKDSISISEITPATNALVEVVVNDNTVPSVKAEVAWKFSLQMRDGSIEPFEYYALSLDDSKNVLSITQYVRSSDYVLEGTSLVLRFGEDWQVAGGGKYLRQGAAEQPAQEVKTEEAKAETKTAKSNDTAAKKTYSAYIYSGTTAGELIRELTNYINTAKAGSTIEFTGKPLMMCYSRATLDKLAERGDVSLKTTFAVDGITYSFTIPAGSDYSNLEDAKYYGFMYLYNAFNGSAEE